MVRRTASTNTLARGFLKALAGDELPLRPTLFLAFEQTAGRGRRGNSWQSPPGAGIYASLALPLPSALRLEALPLAVGIGLCRALNHWLGEGVCGLKWPNDLMVAGQKLGGILIEMPGSPEEEGPWAVIGFGINHRGELPAANAVSLSRLLADGPERRELVEGLIHALWQELERAQDLPATVVRYQAHSVLRPGQSLQCRLQGQVLEGRFRGFDEHGYLLLETQAGLARLSTGEVIENG